ncbi:hypothetical protein ACVBE9_06760 [Eionea flava]
MKKRKYWLGDGDASDQDRFFVDALDSSLWERGDKNNWDTCWYTGMPDESVFESLTSEQTINHIPGNSALTIKSNLYHTLVNAKLRVANTPYAQRFDFFPETFVMPGDYFRFQQTAQQEPKQLWIQKPKNLSRGRGIDMVREPSMVPFDDEWIVQRYLSNPHLCQGKKYVLRCYVLITSVEPLRFYWYQDGFAKLASEEYSADDLHNLYRHLTNPDINEENGSAEAAVTFISFKRYRDWLKNEGHDDEKFFSALKDMITLTVISAREAMRRRNHVLGSENKSCYELIGLDCMVDDDIKPWIIECNLSPSLSTYADAAAGAADEANAKKSMVSDLVCILGLNDTVNGSLTHAERQQYELSHSGGFECLFPSEKSTQYLPVFPVPRYKDIESVQWENKLDLGVLSLLPNKNSDYTFADSLVIFGQSHHLSNSINNAGKTNAHVIAPNELATWIWLKISAGYSPNTIIEELLETLPQSKDVSHSEFLSSISQQVWDVLADWGQANVFSLPCSGGDSNAAKKEAETAYFYWGDQLIELNFFCRTAMHHYKPLFCQPREGDKVYAAIDIVQSSYGYSVVHNRTMLTTQLTLANIFNAIFSSLIKNEVEKGSHLLAACAITTNNKNVLLVSQSDVINDDFSAFIEAYNGQASIANNYFLISSDGSIKGLFMPLKIMNSYLLSDDSSLHARGNGFSYKAIGNNHGSSFDEFLKNSTHLSVIFVTDSEHCTMESLSQSDIAKEFFNAYPSASQASLVRLSNFIDDVDCGYKISLQNSSDGLKKGMDMLMDNKLL